MFEANFLKEITNPNIYKMTEVDRFATRKRLHQENIASHSFIVVYQSMLIADKLKLNDEAKLKLYRMAIVHDLPEAVLGDIISPVKNANEEFRSGYAMLEKKVVREEFPESEDAFLEMVDLEEKEDFLFKILKLADLISVIYYAEQEILLGSRNPEMQEIYYKAVGQCEIIWQEIKAMEQEEGDLWQLKV